MKLRHLVVALGAACLLSGLNAFADPKHDKSEKPAAPAKAECGCEVKADGKVCGVDTDCCCTGAKATGRDAHGKPATAADKAEKKDGEACCADGKCCCGEGAKKDGATCCGADCCEQKPDGEKKA